MNYLKDNIVQILTLLFSGFSTIAVIYLKFYFDKKLKRDALLTDDLRDLDNKLNDRLVEAELDIKKKKYPSENIKKRLLFAGARLHKYDSTLLDEIYNFIHLWELSTDQLERNLINDGEYSKEMSKLLNLIKTIRSKVSKLLK